MTITELKQQLKLLTVDDGDPEMNHGCADELLIEFISQFDPEVKQILDSIIKWYA